MKKYYENLKIKQKIISGFSIVLVLLGFVGTISYLTISSADNGFEDYRHMANNSNLLGRIQANLLESRLKVKDFIKKDDEYSFSEYEKRFSKLQEFIDKALMEVEDPERNAVISEVKKKSNSYERYFAKVKDYMKERDEIVITVLAKTGVTIVNNQLIPRVNAGDANAGNAIRHMLLARLYAIKYLDDNKMDNVKRVRKEFEMIAPFLNRMKSEAITKNVNTYKENFEKLVRIIEDRNNIISTKLDVIGPEIAAAVENIKLYYKDTQEQLGSTVQAQNNNGIITVIVISIIAILVGLVLGLLIANQITKPIATVAERVNELQSVCITNLGNGLTEMAQGNLSARVEKSTKHLNFTQKDETGDMARTVDKMITLAQGGIDAYELVRDKINLLIKETGKLIDDSKNGLLDNRGDRTKFQGAYRDIVVGINDILDEVINPVKEGSSILEKMVKGDLTVRVTGDYKGDHQIIKNSINSLGESLTDVLGQVTEATSATASAANQMSSSAEELAAGSQEQSAQTSEVAASVEQIAATITQTSQHAVETNTSAKDSGNLAKSGQEVIDATINGMQKIEEVVSHSSNIILELGESSVQIGEIIQVINDIADQTNLLALNAAIEAARAGEQGRGFAVVADEVRKLAERTTSATNEIEGMVSKIQSDSQKAVEAIEKGNEEVSKGMNEATKAGESMAKIVNSSDEVLQISTQVAAASEQQSATVEEISRSIDGINSISQESAAGVQQIAAASTDLSRLADNLQSLVAKFKIRRDDNSSMSYVVKKNRTLVNQ